MTDLSGNRFVPIYGLTHTLGDGFVRMYSPVHTLGHGFVPIYAPLHTKGHNFDPIQAPLHPDKLSIASILHQATCCCSIISGNSLYWYCWLRSCGWKPASRMASCIPSAVKRCAAPAADTTFSSIIMEPKSLAPA